MGEASHTGKRPSQRPPPFLGPDFFDRNAGTVARDLIGKALVREHASTRTSYRSWRPRPIWESMT